ncbi:hypothetical protein DKX38_011837 [Salix brachista]|uniref:Uncharacterized protein n=1 Tax=Salix brachista TaxID=2182728 RepID=A0A5N5M2C2_9ROSI|nr:hypothetical protein DKX38_011837 [Salix brachista]
MIFSFLEYLDDLWKKKKKQSFEVLDDTIFIDKKHLRNHLVSSWTMLFFSKVEWLFIAMFICFAMALSGSIFLLVCLSSSLPLPPYLFLRFLTLNCVHRRSLIFAFKTGKEICCHPSYADTLEYSNVDGKIERHENHTMITMSTPI